MQYINIALEEVQMLGLLDKDFIFLKYLSIYLCMYVCILGIVVLQCSVTFYCAAK